MLLLCVVFVNYIFYMFAFTFQVTQSPASLPIHEQHEEQSQASLPTHVQLNFLTTQPNYAYRANNVGLS